MNLTNRSDNRGNMATIWNAVKKLLKDEMPSSTYHLWIEPLQAQNFSEGELVLACPNPFSLRWVQAHYLPLIRQALQNLGQMPPAVQLKLLEAPARPAASPAIQPLLPQVAARTARGTLNQAFTFDNFVVGSSNRLAYQASQALARNDTFYNQLLFITSSPGLGKSHLSQAVGNFVNQTAAGGRVLYLTAENFANEMVGALQSHRMADFKERFRRDCDVLLLEEVQFLSGKEKIQAEVCYTLDTLLGHHKRLVFTSCYLPGEISHISRELRSRLTGGVITPIGPPDFPTRVSILANKAKSRGVQVSDKILEYMAEYITEDVRRLESALDCLVARSSLLNLPFNLPMAQEVLQDLQAVATRLSIPEIQKIVCDYYGVNLAELLGRSRQKRLVRARQLGFYFARLYTEKTMAELGRLFQRSHASVVYALQTLERERKINKRLAQEVQLLEEKLAQAQVRSGSKRASTLRIDA
jgi:chromosomal replication initiator protein